MIHSKFSLQCIVKPQNLGAVAVEFPLTSVGPALHPLHPFKTRFIFIIKIETKFFVFDNRHSWEWMKTRKRTSPKLRESCGAKTKSLTQRCTISSNDALYFFLLMIRNEINFNWLVSIKNVVSLKIIFLSAINLLYELSFSTDVTMRI